MKYDTEKIKSISIYDWMIKNGYKQGRGSSGKWRSFYSPFGSEANASFKIDMNSNKWVDYSAGVTRKQSIIDLVMKINACEFKEACSILTNNTHIEVKEFEPKPSVPGVKIHSVNEITDKELITYFCEKRKIALNILKKYTSQLEISFPCSAKDPNKTYLVGGMQNTTSGWDFRNSYMKLSSAPKSFSKIKGSSDKKVLILEGFLDFCSYMTYYNYDIPPYTAYVLNGLGTINILKPFLENRKILFMLDNDRPADLVLNELSEFDVTDMRHVYMFYSDFNDMLQNLDTE